MKNKVTSSDLLEEQLNSLRREMALLVLERDKQAKEYERRLGELNHENERILNVLEKSIPREVFDREIGSMNAKTQINTDFMNSAKGRGMGMNSVWVIAVAGIVMVCAVISMIIAVLAYTKK